MEFKAGHSWLFSLMRIWVSSTTHFFYRRSYFKGIKDIPNNAAIIFAPNHQSAFMDAIMASEMLKTQNRYLVRADIFKNPTARKALTSFNLLPIYRIRDGVDSMDKNEQIFKTSEDALLRKETMIIFPEGNQADRWQLRELKKGYARIGFGTLKRAAKDFPLFIVPTGINYYHFTDYRSELVVEYGKAIDLQKYKTLVETNEPKAINDLRTELSAAMRPLLFDIQDNANYDAIKSVSHLLSDMKTELSVDFELRKQFFVACGNDLNASNLHQEVMQINHILSDNKVEAGDLRLARNGNLSMLLKPIYLLVSFLTTTINAPLMLPIENFVQNKVKDHHFHASLRFVGCNYLFPVYYGLLLLLTSLIFGWAIGSFVILAMALFSYLGILVKDKLKCHTAKNKIKSKGIDFDVFDTKIAVLITSIKHKL